jgi:hypothetical protein
VRGTLLTAAAAVIGAWAVAGCAQQPASPAANGTPAPGTSTANGTTAPGTSAANGTPAGTACATARPGALTVTTADNGKTLCVRTGTEVMVLLRGTPATMWTSIRSSSAILRPRADPRLMLQRGVTGAAFDAAGSGLAAITSLRYPCRILAPADPGSTTSATTAPPARCGAVMAFRVTIEVT